MHTDSQSAPLPAAPLPVPEFIYHELAFVFASWYNYYRSHFPSERPPLKWLAANSHLPQATCQYYRRRMELAFPDAYAVASAGKNLRLAKTRYKKRVKPTSAH